MHTVSGMAVARCRAVAAGRVLGRVPALVCLTALLGALLVAGCDVEHAGEPGRSGTRADQEIDGFALTQTREGERIWSLKAANALIYEDADRVEMTDLRVDFFDEEGNARSTLTADEGTLERRTNDMEVMGNVVVYAEDGTILTTERLTWNERTGKIESDQPVRVTKGRDVMTGVGVEADPDLKNIRVKSSFKAFVRTEEGTLVEEN
ncbi:MAG: LPS export ABC transporter periplasmic protein LptC [Candidatus Eisenbacteria bacterium]|nr:LPS export ABC transporter periplasmic protein LptC [Candidatus Eisenbacteria bacterium]